jgi:hypothetical protein
LPINAPSFALAAQKNVRHRALHLPSDYKHPRAGRF